MLFFLGQTGSPERLPPSLARSISLTVNGRQIGTVVATIHLNQRSRIASERGAGHARTGW